MNMPKPISPSISWLEDMILQGMDGDFIIKAEITPELAAELLKRNTRNRPIKNKLQEYKSAMAHGLWRPSNGETIKVGADGVLGDGQHRLMAMVETGLTYEMYIMFGASAADLDTIDQGATRSAGDIHALRGGTYSNTVAAIARKALSFELTEGRSLSSISISNAEILKRLERDPALLEAAVWANAKRVPALAVSALGFLFYVFTLRSPNLAKIYLEQLSSGLNLTVNDPASTVRNYLITRSPRGTKIGSTQKKMEAVIRGWNAAREGRKLSQVVTTGEYPEII